MKKRWRARLQFMAGFLIIGGLAFALNSCGSSGGGGGSTGGGTTTINNATQGGAAAGAGSAGATAGTGLADVASSLGSIGGSSLGLSLPNKPMNPLTAKDPKLVKMVGAAQKVAKSKAISKAAANLKAAKTKTAFAVGSGVPDPCADGGTVTYTGNDDPAATDVTFDFAYCKEGGEISDGLLHMTGSYIPDAITATSAAGSANVTITLSGRSASTDFLVQTFEDDTYALSLGIFTTDMSLAESATYNASFSIDQTSGQVTSGTSTFTSTLTANGSAAFEDQTVVPSQTTNLTMSDFKDTGTFSSDFSTGIATFDETLDGGVSESWTETDGTHTVAVGFVAFKTSGTASGGLASPAILSHDPYGSVDISFSGTVSVNFEPNSDCEIEGTFNFVTDPNEPLHIGFDDSCPVSGKLTINGSTTVQFGAAADASYPAGHVDVTTGSETKHYKDCNELDNECQVEDFEQQPTSETTISGGGSATTSGSTLVANLSWSPYDNGANGVIMDLHVNYYATSAPTATTMGTWYIDYHNRDVADVLPDNANLDGNLETYSIGNSTNDEATDFDRLVIDGLPQGYYVISVNSWYIGTAPSPPGVTTDVTLDIGGNVFTFPSCTFTASDGEYQDPNSWCAVTDMRVNADGTVDILPHDSALELWHDGALMLKPALPKARTGAGR